MAKSFYGVGGGSKSGGVAPEDVMSKSVYDTNDNGIVDAAESVEIKASLGETVAAGKLVCVLGVPKVGGLPVVGIADNSVTGRDVCIGAAKSGGVLGDVITVVVVGKIATDTTFFGAGIVLSLGQNGNLFDSPQGKDQRVGIALDSLLAGEVFINVDLSNSPELPALLNGEIPQYNTDSGQYEGSGIIHDTVTNQIRAGGNTLYIDQVITEAASVYIGPGLKLSDNGGFLVTESQVTGNRFINIDSKIDDTGSERPIWYRRAAKEIAVPIQTDETQNLSINQVTLTATNDTELSKVYLSFHSAQTNFRFAAVSSATGEVIRYYPNRHDFSQGIGDTFAAGYHQFEFPPVSVPAGIDVTVYFYANEPIALKGNSSLIPWYAVDRQIYSQEFVSTYADPISETSLSEKSTRAKSGLVPSADGALGVATTFSVTAGEMELYDTPFVSDAASAHTVPVAALTNATPTYTLPQLNWIVSSGLTGLVEMRITPPNAQQRRYESVLGVVAYDGAVITNVFETRQNYNQVGNQVIDFMAAVGNFVVTGLSITPATAGGLAIQMSQGSVFGSNINQASDYNPHISGFTAQDPANNMTRYLGDGTIQSLSVTAIDPANYNPAGGNTYVAVPGDSNAAQIIRIYLNVDSGEVIYVPGQTVYTSISEAAKEFLSYSPTLPQLASIRSALLRSIIVRKGAANLSLESDAVFVGKSKFAEIPPQIGGGGDIEPTPLDGNRVAYNTATGKLADTGEFAPITAIASNPFTVPAGVNRARYIVGVAGADTIINLPLGAAGMEYEFINDGTWGAGGFYPKVELFESPLTYSYQLDTSPDATVHPYESYTFFHNGLKWGVYNNG